MLATSICTYLCCAERCQALTTMHSACKACRVCSKSFIILLLCRQHPTTDSKVSHATLVGM